MLALSQRVLREMPQETREQYRGHPHGKRPDALPRLHMWRVAQLITEEIVAATPDPGKQVLLNFREVGTAAQTSTELRAFVVPTDDNDVKWIWAAESQPEHRVMGRALRDSGLLSQIGIAAEEGTVPSNKQAKIVRKLMNERKADQTQKFKKGKNGSP